jgi:S locus-related glycoprotein 1 binding pollen coat protein (SLR1-BP)
MIPKVEAIKRCIATLSSSGCDLSTCRRQCYESYGQQNGFGSYIEGKSQVYACICSYDCDRWLFIANILTFIINAFKLNKILKAIILILFLSNWN